MSAARTRTLAALSSVDGRFALSPPSLLRTSVIARTGRRS